MYKIILDRQSTVIKLKNNWLTLLKFLF